jgi:hypothetical protein
VATGILVDVRQKNGEEYEPSYIRGMLDSFERHRKRKNYGISLISGYEFYKARDVLKCKQKDLKKKEKEICQSVLSNTTKYLIA